MTRWEEINAYWIDDLGEEGWYRGGAELDAEIRGRFEEDWHRLMRGEYEHWRCGPRRTLAYLILADQMPRNMFRGTAGAYASDGRARAAAYAAVNQGWDMQTALPERQFFYLPFEHSESLSDQERCVRLMMLRMESAESVLHARAHREVIRRFGRFPYRNAHLGRATTPAEQVLLDRGGYAAALEDVKAAA